MLWQSWTSSTKHGVPCSWYTCSPTELCMTKTARGFTAEKRTEHMFFVMCLGGWGDGFQFSKSKKNKSQVSIGAKLSKAGKACMKLIARATKALQLVIWIW